MPGNSASRLPSGPICSAPCATARSTGFAKRTDGIPIEGPEPLFTNPEALQLEADEMMLLVAEAVSQLPDRCREVFRKSREEGLSNAAIADQMRISVKTVEAQITKALRRIRETLLRT